MWTGLHSHLQRHALASNVVERALGRCQLLWTHRPQAAQFTRTLQRLARLSRPHSTSAAARRAAPPSWAAAVAGCPSLPEQLLPIGRLAASLGEPSCAGAALTSHRQASQPANELRCKGSLQRRLQRLRLCCQVATQLRCIHTCCSGCLLLLLLCVAMAQLGIQLGHPAAQVIIVCNECGTWGHAQPEVGVAYPASWHANQ